VTVILLIKIQPDATVSRYLFTAKSLYVFRVSRHPSSGVLKTVTATSGTGHNTGTAPSLQRGLIFYLSLSFPNILAVPQFREVSVSYYAINLRSFDQEEGGGGGRHMNPS